MATLKIDVVLNDAGAEQKLAAINTAVRGVDAASASATASIQKHSSASVSAFSSMSSAAMGFLKTATAMYGGILLDRGIVAMAGLARESFRMAGALTDLSAKSGLTISTLQKLDYVGSQAGVTMEAFADAAFMLGVRLGKGSDSVVAAVSQLGLNFKELRAMSPDQQMNAILSALSKVGSEQERNRLGVELFGRSFKSISASVTSDYEEMARAARTSGDAQMRALDKASDAWDAWVKNRKADAAAAMGTLVMVGQAAQSSGAWNSVKNFISGVWNTGTTAASMNPSNLVGSLVAAGSAGVLAGAPRDLKDVHLSNPNAKTGEELDDERKELERLAKEAKAQAEAIAKRRDDLSGRADMVSAQEMLTDVKAIGGLTMLTDEATKKLNETLGKALDYYKRIGQVAPEAMRDTYVETMRLGLEPLNASLPLPGTNVGIPEVPLPFLELEHLTQLPGQNVGMPTIPKPPSFFQQTFGDPKQFAGMLSGIAMQALTGGGNVGGSLGGAVGGQLAGKLAKDLVGKLAGKGIGAAIGGIAGSVVPVLGNIVGGWLGGKVGGWLGGLFGGGKEAKETNQKRDEVIQQFGGVANLKKTFDELGLSADKFFSTKKVKDFQAEVEKLDAAMQAKKDRLEGIGLITAGANARAANISGQGDLNVVSAAAMGSLGLQIGEGTSPIEALANLSPAIDAMRMAMAGGNFELSVAGQKLLELAGVVETNRIGFTNLAADGQILQGMMKGNIADFDLFKTIAADVGVQLQGMIDKGVPTAQVLALAQPQLQSLWEAQQRWHVEVDGTTQSLIDQAVQHGIVGEQMKSVHERTLSVLIAIGDVLGAQIPDALRGLPSAAQEAAEGMQSAFDGIRGPSISMSPDDAQAWLDAGEAPEIAAYEAPEEFHHGGLLWRRMHGGGLASDEIPIIGQRGEFMMSRRGVAAVGVRNLEAMNRGVSPGGGTMTIIVERDGEREATYMMPFIANEVRRLGLI